MQQLRVLVADDDKDAVASLMLLLQEEGHEVRGVYSGLAVLDKVRDFGPDVVLLDIGMPHISGYEVARALRERYASARPLLIAITGHSKPTDRTLAQLAGFDHHFAKPYDPKALLALLRASGAATRSRAAPETPDPAALPGRPTSH
ncbi:MAG: response regulator [Betaproteobacteria bacterium]|nr:MAG: response regulator [Betaproteobacteria bacterium]